MQNGILRHRPFELRVVGYGVCHHRCRQMCQSTKQAAAEARMGTNSKYTQLRTFLMAEFMAGNAVE